MDAMAPSSLGTEAEADLSGADKGGKSGSQVLPAAVLHDTQPSGRSEKVKLEPEAQMAPSQEHAQQRSQHQHHEQNSPNLPKAEQEQERDPQANAGDRARLETKRLRNQKKRLRRRLRRKHRKWDISRAEIKTLQAQLKVAEEERDQAQTNKSALEKSSEDIRNQLEQTKEDLRVAANAGQDLRGHLELAVATLGQERRRFSATVASHAETQARLEAAVAALDQERKRCGELTADYNEINGRLGENVVDLNQERKLREAAETKNSQWKKDYNELAAKMTTERQGTHDKLTDEYLITEAQKLDFNIRKFAQMYFGDADPQSAAFSFNVRVATSEADVDQMMVFRTLPGYCARVAQSRLWSILVRTVLGRYVWCLDRKESRLGRAIVGAETSMERLIPRFHPDKTQLEVRQKFHDWRAHAASHCLQSSGTEDSGASSSDELDSSLLNAVSAWLGPQRRQSIDHAAFAKGLGRILAQSVKMDKEISRQPSDVKWLLPAMSANFNFSPQWMDLVDGEVAGQSRRAVLLCVSPGLVRYGNCSGGDFENEKLLRSVEVSGNAVVSARGLGQGLRLGGSIATEIGAS